MGDPLRMDCDSFVLSFSKADRISLTINLMLTVMIASCDKKDQRFIRKALERDRFKVIPYLKRFLKLSQVSLTCLLNGLFLFQKANGPMSKKAGKSFKQCHILHKMKWPGLLAAIITSEKFNCDAALDNSFWILPSKYSITEINWFEWYFLDVISYDLVIGKSRFIQYIQFLRTWMSIQTLAFNSQFSFPLTYSHLEASFCSLHKDDLVFMEYFQSRIQWMLQSILYTSVSYFIAYVSAVAAIAASANFLLYNFSLLFPAK